jgi:uncharacterized protein YciI
MPEKNAVKKHYVLKSITCRVNFDKDMTQEERAVMGKHIAYWTDKLNNGTVLLFGPVFEQAGTYGIAIMEVEDEAEILSSIEEDPAVIAGLLNTGFSLMLAVLPK